jgi:hypothetical protein
LNQVVESRLDLFVEFFEGGVGSAGVLDDGLGRDLKRLVSQATS